MSKRQKEENIRRFNLLIEIANDIINKNDVFHSRILTYEESSQIRKMEHPIISYVSMLGRKVQAEAMLDFTFQEKFKKNDFDQISFYEFMHHKIPVYIDGTKQMRHPCILIEETDQKATVDLSCNLVLPWPWHPQRLVNNIISIWEWKEDIINHNVVVWLPVGICWVNSGNHSIAAGILKGMGVIRNAKTADISKLYDHIETDGAFYRNRADKSKICEVKNVEMAAIFEIGRLMLEKGICFKGVAYGKG